jgi:hypothetical protein
VDPGTEIGAPAIDGTSVVLKITASVLGDRPVELVPRLRLEGMSEVMTGEAVTLK